MHLIIVSSLVNNPELIGELLLDINGNYVVQKALAVAKGKYYNEILEKIAENLDHLQMVSYGSKLISKLIGIYPELGYIKLRQQYKYIMATQTLSYASFINSRNSSCLCMNPPNVNYQMNQRFHHQKLKNHQISSYGQALKNFGNNLYFNSIHQS